MESKGFFNLFFGKEPLAKNEFVKAWLGWWVIFVVVVVVLWLTPLTNLRFIGIAFSLGFCQITSRYAITLGWNKYWGVLGFFPVTNIVLFLVFIFMPKK